MAFIAHNPVSGRHDLPGHPETAARAASILGAFDKDATLARLPRLTPDRPLTREEALSTHSARLWLNLETLGPELPAFLDPDTYVVEASFEAAATTARLGMQAIERSMREAEPGFVVARPPGHHATQDRSMGFCLLNNVAIAANHALARGAKRVLVFDHDVHHGNGTQDIFFASDRVLYQSFHLHPHYPGTGRVDDVGVGAGQGYTMNAPLTVGDGEEEVRSLVENVFLPTARQFRPDLVLFSSGFDSLAGDPLGGLTLSAPFFGELAAGFRTVSPRLVCFLEGGYQIAEIPKAATAQLRALLGPERSSAGPTRAPGCEADLSRRLSEWWPVLDTAR